MAILDFCKKRKAEMQRTKICNEGTFNFQIRESSLHYYCRTTAGKVFAILSCIVENT